MSLAEKKLVLEYVSASQTEAFLNCNRKWLNKSVLKLPEKFTPAAARGSRVHKGGEIYLLTGKPGVVPKEDVGILSALIAALPQRAPHLLVEHKFEIATYPGGPIWTGYIDLLDPLFKEGQILVQDQKSRSDLRYAKKPQDLLKDVQMLSYAEYVFETYDVDEVLLKHLYVCTTPSGRKPNKYHKTFPVEVVASRKHVLAEWQKILNTVRRMVEAYAQYVAGTIKSGKDLPPNVVHCDAYGGCSYKSICGVVAGFSNGKGMFAGASAPAVSPVVQIQKKERPMGLAEKLKEKAAAKAAAGGTPPPVIPAKPAPAAAAPKAAAAPAKPAAKPPEVATPPAAVAPATGGLAAKLAAKKAANGTVAPAPKVALNPPDAPPDVKSTAADVPAPETIEGEGEDEVQEEKPKAAVPKKPKAAKKTGPSSALLDAATDEPDAMADVGTLDPDAGDKPRGQVNGEDTDAAEGEVGPTMRPDDMPEPTGETAAPPAEGFVLYVDCIPVKGEQGYVMFEDWFRPLAETLANNFGVADYRVVEFGKWKGPLANLVRMAINEGAVPPVMLISSYAPGSNEALDILVPYARRVVRALKG